MSTGIRVDNAVRTDDGWSFRVHDVSGIRLVEVPYAVVPVDEPEAALRLIKRVLVSASR